MKKSLSILFLFLVVVSSNLVAQYFSSPPNLPHHELKTWHFGFTLGPEMHHVRIANNSENIYDLLPSQFQEDIPSVDEQVYCYSEKTNSTVGLQVGIIASRRLGKHFNLRIIPSLALGQPQEIKSKLYYNDGNQLMPDTFHLATNHINSTYIALPILLKYKALRINNFQPFLIGGVNLKYDLAVKKEDPITLKRSDVSLEIGFGGDFYLQEFRLGFEVRFGIGMFDILDDTYSETKLSEYYITQSIQHIKARTLTIAVNFE